jgi:hypothetical protein
MNQSESIAALAAALSKAQSAITGALKDSANPFFKSKYADLAACWDACRSQLAANNLAVIQTTEVTDRDRARHHPRALERRVDARVPARTDQGRRAAGTGQRLTYARRYALAAMVGLAQIDDDGEAAQARGKKEPTPDIAKKVAGCQSVADLTALFQSLPEADRAASTALFAARKKELA